MTHMIFRHGDMKKWKGVGYDFEIVKAEELQYLDAGWFHILMTFEGCSRAGARARRKTA